MADSQNTYQNDVKIKSENNFSKILIGVIAAAVIGFGGYEIYNTKIEKAYENGYDKGYDEGYDEGYDNGYDEGDDDGYSKGHSDGYSKGYKEAKEKYENTFNSSGKNSSKNTTNNSSNKTSSSSSNNEKSYSYVLNKNTDKFHYSWCSSVNQMKEKNKVYFNGTRTEAINKGYAPCKNCNP